MRTTSCVQLAVALLLGTGLVSARTPVGTAFTYQGVLKDGNVPVNTTSASFRCALFDALTGGTQIGTTVSASHVGVTNGLFSLAIDFGVDAFGSQARWLEISVYKNGTGWITLSPRQQLTPAPAAVFASNAASLELPFDASVTTDSAAFAIHATGAEGAITVLAEQTGPESTAVRAVNSGTDGAAIQALVSGQYGTGVYASATGASGYAVYGYGGANASGGGMFAATSTTGAGVEGRTGSATGRGVFGNALSTSGTNYGVYGATASAAGYGGYFAGRGFFSSNLGVGVTEPAAMLDVAGGNFDLIGTEGDFRLGTSAYRLKFGVATSGGNAGQARLRAQAITGTPKIILGAGSFDMLTVTSTNVGVGTLGPASDAKLDVNGKLKASTLQLTSGATSGYVLTCDPNGNATWQAPTGSGTFDLPYEGTLSSGSAGIKITNNGSGAGLFGIGGNYGVRGESASNAVYGFSPSGNAVSGNSNTGVAVRAQGGGVGVDHAALRVDNSDPNGIAAFATCSSADAAIVIANSGSGDIIRGFSGSGGGDLVFRVENNGTTSVGVLKITGGADLSEQFDVQSDKDDVKPGMVVCIDPANPGKLVASSKAYDRTVAGVISGAGGVKPGMLMGQRDTVADGQHPIALTGRVYVWADASMGAIEAGDLLTTSDVPGHAMKATNYERSRGATVGKAMSRLADGRGLVLILVQPQ